MRRSAQGHMWHTFVLGVTLLTACSLLASCDGGVESADGGDDGQAAATDGVPLAASGESTEAGGESIAAPGGQANPVKIPAIAGPDGMELRRRLAAGEVVDALIVVDEAPIEAELLALSGRPDRSQDGPELVALRAMRLREVVQRATFAAARLSGFTVRRTWEHLPIVAIRLAGEESLDALATPDVLAVEPEREYLPSLAQSLPLIGQPAAQAAGMGGAGTTVAVLDTGVQYSLASFGSCTSPGVPASCKVAYAQDFAPNDGLLDDAARHGTNVAAIVAGVAPQAKIAALDVFSGASASSTHILSAINWVIANKATYNIVALNLSLGSGAHTSPCPSDVLATGVASARSAGVLAAVATGNDAYTNAVGTPACGPAAVSVGAVYDSALAPMQFGNCVESSAAADKVACFSNAASFITLLAPGAMIDAGGVVKAGTSMASPHVAGAIAVLRGAFPTETPDQIVERLTSTGKPLTDWRNGLTKPRLNLAAAVTTCVTAASWSGGTVAASGGPGTINVAATAGCDWQAQSPAQWLVITSGAAGTGPGAVTFSVAQNTGQARSATLTIGGHGVTISQAATTTTPTLSINGGAPATVGAAVTLAIEAPSPSPFPTMCVSNATTCTAFKAFAASSSWTLVTGNGAKTVRAWLRYPDGATVGPIIDTIILDAAAPTNGTVAVSPGVGSNTVSWSGFTDANSGVVAYRVRWAPGVAPASCAAGTLLYEGGDTHVEHGGLVSGTKIAYRVCAIDAAGNTSSGSIAAGTPVPELDPPDGTMMIAGGASVTKSAAVTLNITATDASPVTSMCISNTATCGAFVAFSATPKLTLTAGNGLKTVRVWLRDAWGNTTQPLIATIWLDATPPVNGTVTVDKLAGALALSWSGFSDASIGIAGYRVVGGGATAPASCATGTIVYQGLETEHLAAGLIDGKTYAYRVCAIDGAGWMSTGVAVTGIPAPEFVPPTGAMTINGGNPWTSATAVTLAIAASDESGLAQMCVSNATTCTAWTAFSPTKSWALTAGTGAKTVRVWLRDIYQNTTVAPVSASINLDATNPVDGKVAVDRGDGQIGMSFTGFSDANSGIAGYRVVSGATMSPASCAVGTLLTSGADPGFTHTGLTNGSTYFYRVCAIDVSGRVSTGVALSAVPAPELAPPTGTVTINGGATMVAGLNVTLTLEASDASGVAKMCISNTAACTAWKPYATTSAWTLAAGSGPHTVYVSYADIYTNASKPPVTAAIYADATLPVNGLLKATPGAGSMQLTWSGFSDAHSGIAGYKLVAAPTAPPATCKAGTVIHQGPGNAFLHGGLTAGAKWGYRICAFDVAGSFSTGVTVIGIAK